MARRLPRSEPTQEAARKVGWGHQRRRQQEEKGNATMPSITTTVMTLSFALSAVLMTAVPSSAQSSQSNAGDSWAHTVSPDAKGQCWIPTDRIDSERGFGYMGACPAGTADNARAQASHPHHKTNH
jgi:hypothetical protein